MSAIYTVTCADSDSGLMAFPTKQEALAFARLGGSERIEVTRMEITKLPARQLLCALFNHEGFARKMEVIATFDNSA